MKLRYLLIILPLVFACDKEKHFEGPDELIEDFESAEHIEALLSDKWSFVQRTFNENTLSIDTIISHSGHKSFKSTAVPTSNDVASKASINKQFMAFWEGETVAIEFWCYLVGTDPLNWLFLFDLEEKVNIGAGPGMRLALVENQLRIEHKYLNPDLVQAEHSALDFPRNQWVKINLEISLAQQKTGTVRLWQDDQLIIQQDNWQTLPKDLLYVNQGTKGMYSQVEFGITANSPDNSAVLYVDDIEVKVK